jgi:hypothetical protein
MASTAMCGIPQLRFMVFLVVVWMLSHQAVHAQTRSPPPQPVARPTAQVAPAPTRALDLFATVSLADIGFTDGFRFGNLGGRRQVFMPLPQGGEAMADEFVLVLEDVSAYEARRNLIVMINDRVATIGLDGHSTTRVVRIPVPKVKTKDGFLKLTFIYSGAATQDRCIDVRSVGDSLIIRPESAVEVDVGPTNALDIPTTVALMPHEVAILLPKRRLSPTEIATAMTVARAFAASGHRTSFVQGTGDLPEISKVGETRRWTRGLVMVGQIDDVGTFIDAPLATVAGPVPALGSMTAVRVSGVPALLVSEAAAGQVGRLLASSSLAATRGLPVALVGEVSPAALPIDRVTFDQIGIPPIEAEVFGRADLTLTIDTRRLPAGRRPLRILLDVMVAPDGDADRAVVSVFVNEHLLGSKLAAIGEATRLDLPLPDGLAGTTLSVRAVVQRRSAQGDCRFEPQGYPAQILDSSAVVLGAADGQVRDFSDLAFRWADGVAVELPASAADAPVPVIGLLSEVLNLLTPPSATVSVSLVAPGPVPTSKSPFLVVSEEPPQGSAPRVRFDRGRVAVSDHAGHTLLDLSGFTTGAVVQAVSAGNVPGMWIRPLASDGSLPTPSSLRLDRGDVAFVDHTGVALAMSTERDTLLKISYPDQVSWLTIAERFRAWIIGCVWLLVTIVFLLGLQRSLRRRRAASSD